MTAVVGPVKDQIKTNYVHGNKFDPDDEMVYYLFEANIASGEEPPELSGSSYYVDIYLLSSPLLQESPENGNRGYKYKTLIAFDMTIYSAIYVISKIFKENPNADSYA